MHGTDSANIISIGAVVRNAATFNLRKAEYSPMALDSLFQTVQDLFALLAERSVEYVLVGGIAMLQYVEGRNTEDIDLIVATNALRVLPEIDIQQQGAFFTRGTFRGLQIDFLLTDNRLFKTVQTHYVTTHRFMEREIVTATVEGLLLLKLYALPAFYRQGEFTRVSIYEGDVAALLQAYKPEIEPFYAELANHLSDTDMAGVKSVVDEIQQRIERFERRFRNVE
jgi:hypothetical protein